MFYNKILLKFLKLNIEFFFFRNLQYIKNLINILIPKTSKQIEVLKQVILNYLI